MFLYISDTDTKSAAVALMERNHVKDNIAPKKCLPVPNVLVRSTTTLLPKCPVKVTQTNTVPPSVTDLWPPVIATVTSAQDVKHDPNNASNEVSPSLSITVTVQYFAASQKLQQLSVALSA